MHPTRQTWRVRGIPLDFDKRRLADVLQRHPSLKITKTAGENGDDNNSDNEVWVHTLAPDLRSDQVAAIRFRHLPVQLATLEHNDQLAIDIQVSFKNAHTGGEENGDSLQTARLVIDQHFNGITVLRAPPTGEHRIDVVAVPGLGGHPFGSFVHKGDGHMWLSNSLPQDMPTARVMIYGYKSGLQGSNSFAHLGDLASSLQIAVCRLLRSEKKHLILIGHSLGGLLIKEALIGIAESDSDSDSDLIGLIFGTLFLGVPNDGTDIESLIPIVSDQPNRFLLESLNYINPQILTLQKRNFSRVLERSDFEMFCFYETKLSPTAAKDSTGQYKRDGTPRCLVSPTSATSCLPSGVLSDHSIAIDRTHSDLVKFASHDDEYDKVSYVLSQMHQRTTVRQSKHYYAVPLETVHTYAQREKLWKELERKLSIRHNKASVPHAVVICGLGGSGKSQLALKYAEDKREQYNPILWIDAIDEEAMLSSFERCAAELGLAIDQAGEKASATNAAVVQIVLQWLHNRADADDEWLVIVDNADDLGLGIKKIIPKGERGNIIITSRDNRSPMLLPRGCELIQVGPMSQLEGATLLLNHLLLDADSVPEIIRQRCDEVAEKLGYLPLAIDLAGAYIGNDSDPEQALTQYLADYDTHRDELLQMDNFRGLLSTEKTVWTVWDTTLEKITNDYGLQPGLLLTFLAHFKGNIIQDEVFRLASLGMAEVNDNLDDKIEDGIPVELQKFVTLERSNWDSFLYRQSRDILLRYSLLQRVDGEWPGVTMHSLVQWRAMQDDRSRQWSWWYTVFMLAACFRVIEEEGQPEFRRHLMVQLPDTSGVYNRGSRETKYETLVGDTLGRVYYAEGRWEEAEKLFVQVMETRKNKLGANHPYTLISMANLASTYRNQGRWEEAEKLEVQVMETSKNKLGADHPDTLMCMNNLASTYRNQDRWKEAEKLDMQVMETRKSKLGVDHPDTLISMANLASTYRNQGRWEEAEKLGVQVMETRKTKFGADHPDTLTSMNNLAFTWKSQCQHLDALALMKDCVNASQRILGREHPHTLSSLAALEKWSS